MSSKQLVCLNEYEKEALAILDRNSSSYYQSGANDEQTLHDNINDFKRFRLRPRMLTDVSEVRLETTILGERISMPICIAPTASQRMAHPLGEIANARAAEAMNTCFVLSTIATTSARELSEHVPNSLRWYQLYITRDRAITQKMVKRAEVYGFKALVLTVDTPTFGTRYSDTRIKFKVPQHLRMANFDGIPSMESGMANNSGGSGLNFFSDTFFDPSVTWKDVAWLKSITALPVVAKGILTGEDAERAIEAGVDAIIVSNHGARQLDGVFSTIIALPEVVAQVRGRVEVYLDGGVRKGTDVLKALSLGARAVFIGRPALYGLAVGGEQGVTDILSILKKELKLAMQLSGETDVQKLRKGLVIHESMMTRL
ncbi:2-Hydroxyacid oxidase 1-like [Watersipora subatra]|uniref:2-Hydroxyacid oxidase 1-like n=1 Tax=Watersipora subatra TaxID=2589382 RepID=UPI00355B157D